MNWLEFFQQNNINYRTSGANVSKGSAVIHCPMCGAADESEHLVVNLDNKGFHCWRNRQHSGKNPAKLIQALLNCSWEQAASMAGQAHSLPSDFMGKLKSTLFKPEVLQPVNNLKLPDAFKKFTGLPSSLPYLNYLSDRGFTYKDANQYEVYYATQGVYKGRILFTIYHEQKLVGWTGRTIYPSEQMRYKSLTSKEDKAKENGEVPAPNPISHYLLFSDRLFESYSHTIVMCEGPFDSFKVNVLGNDVGVDATCFFTNTPSQQQINLLHDLLPKYQRKCLMLDQNTFSQTARTKALLSSFDIEIVRLPSSVKDPGEITSTKQLQEILD